MRVGLDSGVPVIFGVLTCLTEEQVKTKSLQFSIMGEYSVHPLLPLKKNSFDEWIVWMCVLACVCVWDEGIGFLNFET